VLLPAFPLAFPRPPPPARGRRTRGPSALSPFRRRPSWRLHSLAGSV
jgi:hypothetical protein